MHRTKKKKRIKEEGEQTKIKTTKQPMNKENSAKAHKTIPVPSSQSSPLKTVFRGDWAWRKGGKRKKSRKAKKRERKISWGGRVFIERGSTFKLR